MVRTEVKKKAAVNTVRLAQTNMYKIRKAIKKEAHGNKLK